MDRHDEKPPLKPEDDGHPPVAAGLPSYQEATTGLAQPPPAYLAPGSRTPGADSAIAHDPDEKRAGRAYDDASSPTTPSQPLTFSISFQSSWLLQKKIHIKPADVSGPTNSNTTRWEVDYTSKYNATMNRLEGAGAATTTPPPRNVATFKFPEFIVPSACGVTITFMPHEAEDPRHASPTVRFMHTTGMVTTKYALDLPVMRNARYVWQTSYRGSDDRGGAGQTQGDEKARLQQHFSMAEKGIHAGVGGNPTTPPSRAQAPSASSSRSVATAPAFDFSNLLSDTWTPYTTQYLVNDEQGHTHVLARYTRAAPWASERGKLEIFLSNKRDDGLQPKFLGAALVEGIIISCAAMVGMQDRLGLASSLVEAYADNYVGKGKGRA